MLSELSAFEEGFFELAGALRRNALEGFEPLRFLEVDELSEDTEKVRVDL